MRLQTILTVLAAGLSALLWLASCAGEQKEPAETDTAAAEQPKEKERKSPSAYAIGDVVEDFSLKNIDGNRVSLASLGEDAKGATVVFTCNTCPYAVKYEDRLVELGEKAAKAGYPLLAIMPNDTELKPGDKLEEMKKRAEEKGFGFPYVIDAEQSVFPKFGASKTPEVFLLQKTEEGFKLVYKGAIDDNVEEPEAVKVRYVEQAIAALDAGEEISPKSTKAIGCSIKVKK